MAKSLLTVRISDEAQEALKILCEKDDRSKGYIIEKLILEASGTKPKSDKKKS